MKLLTKALETKLRKNSESASSCRDIKPVVKFFNPMGAATWLITEMDAEGIMFGLCDLGMGYPEIGYVSLEEMQSVRLPFGLRIERDMYFTPKFTLQEYAERAEQAGRIVT